MFRQEQERIASSSAVSKDSGTAGAVLLTVMHVEPTRFVSQLAALVLVLADGLTLRSSRNCIATPSTWQKNLAIMTAQSFNRSEDAQVGKTRIRTCTLW